MDCIVCLTCERVTDAWVMRCEQYVEEVDFFCSDTCLAKWLNERSIIDDPHDVYES